MKILYIKNETIEERKSYLNYDFDRFILIYY